MAEESRRDRLAIVILAVICAAAFFIRFYHAGDAFGGYHCFNEGWYSTLARNYETHSLLFPISVFGTLDYNVVPFYSWIIYAAERIFGDTELTYRTTTIAFCVLSLVFLYLIGKRFYGRRAGLAAAALYGFCPISVMIGRNVQTDSVYLCFLLICTHLYLKGVDEKRPRLLGWSGLFYGMSFFTKQFAILWLPAVGMWELARGRGFRTLNRGHIYFALCALILPGPFFAYHIATRAGQIVADQTYLGASQIISLNLAEFQHVFTEVYWALSPLIFVLCFFAAAFAIYKRRRGDVFLLCMTAVFIVFIITFHGHSYYQLYGAPFLCLLAGGMLARMRARWFSAIVLPVALAGVQTLAFFCAVKYGYDELKTIGDLVKDQKNVTLILDEGVRGNYRPPLQYYCRHATIVLERDLVRDPRTLAYRKSVTLPARGGPVYLVSFPDRPGENLPPNPMMIKRRKLSLVLLGRQIGVFVPSEHYFRIGGEGRDGLYIQRVGSLTDNGLREIGEDKSLLVTRVEPGVTVPVADGKLVFSRKAYTNKQ